MTQNQLFNLRFWFIVDFIIAVIGIVFWTFVFYFLSQNIGWIRSIPTTMFFTVTSVAIILILALIVFALKIWQRRLYGMIEVSFAIVFAWNLIRNSSILTTVEFYIALGSTIYLIVRGLSNWLQGIELKTKKFSTSP